MWNIAMAPGDDPNMGLVRFLGVIACARAADGGPPIVTMLAT